jgi:hypothetical protein
MSEANHLATALSEYFRNPENGAFADFSAATDGLTAAQAAAVPGERMNSVWAVVNHVWFWNEAPLRKLRGEQVDPADLGAADWSGWIPAGDPSDDAAWHAARARALEANTAFAAAVAELTPEQLAADLPGWGAAHGIVQGMLAHNAYHTGEIITIRHIQKLWVNNKNV